MNTVEELLAENLCKAESCKFNTRTCSCLAQVLSDAAKRLSGNSDSAGVNSQFGFFKLVHDIRKWMDLNTRPAAGRVPRRALHNIWTRVNCVLEQVGETMQTNLSTAAPANIEKYWELDVIEQMLMKDLLCVVLWVQQDIEGSPVDDSSEAFMERFDTDNVAVFRISSLTLLDRLGSFESHLSGAKFDGRIRIVLNVKDPVSTLKQVLTFGYLRHIPVLVNMACVECPEDSIYELSRLKSDIQFSVKSGDFDKYCSFATVLWINYKDDPNRTIVEKRVSKTGVVIQKTDSMEKGLKYMDAHGHLAYLNEFRIVIGDGKLILDETAEAALQTNKKRDFFAQRATAMRQKGGAATGKGEEEFSTLELVQVIRNRQKWHTPILVFSYDACLSEPELYSFKSLKTTIDLDTLEYFAMMKALPWAVDLPAIRADANLSLPGHLRIVNLRCSNLIPRKFSSTMDPYVIIKVGDTFQKKTKKFSSSLNPTWNLGWEIPCKLTDRITLQVLDKNMFGKHEFEAHYEGLISELIPVATPLVEVTKALESTKSTSNKLHQRIASNSDKDSSSTAISANSASSPAVLLPGTITIEVGFRFEGHSERILGRHFGQPFETSIDATIRDAIPHITESIVCYLMQNGLECEGIFRQPHNQKRVDALRDQIDKGSSVDFTNENCHDVAFLLRTYLKELPQPLITRTKYESFKACSTIEKRRDHLVALSDVLGQLPPYNLEAFANIIHLLAEIAKHEVVNKMAARNLATVLGPALIIPKDVEADAATYLADTTAVTTVLESCIAYCHKLFQKQDINAAVDGSMRKKSKTSVRSFIDPYLTDSISSPRGAPGDKRHARGLSDSADIYRKKNKEWITADFVLKELQVDSVNMNPPDPYAEVAGVVNSEENDADVKTRSDAALNDSTRSDEEEP